MLPAIISHAEYIINEMFRFDGLPRWLRAIIGGDRRKHSGGNS